MTEKYRKTVNAPIKFVHRKLKNIYHIDAQTKTKKVLKGSALVGVGLAEFMMRVAKIVALDNKILRKLEKKLSEIHVGTDKNGYEKKFQSFVKKNPNLSAVAIWWTMLSVLIFGGDFNHKKNIEQDSLNQKKEIKSGQNVDKSDVVDYRVVARHSDVNKKLSTPIKLTDKASVKKAVVDNFAYVQAVLFSTENYRTDWFSDNISGPKNTLGVGLFYIPVDPYNFKSTKWKQTKTMYNVYPKSKTGSPRDLTDNEVYDGIEGWFFYMDNGYNFKFMQNALAGHNISLTPRDLTVISSVLFNSLECGKKFCEYIVAHPNNRKAWAKYLLRVDDEVNVERLRNFQGLKARRVHEILLLLDVDGYCQDMFGVQIDCKRASAVSYANNYFDKLKRDFSKSIMLQAKNTICNGVVENGVSVCQCISRSDKYSDGVFAYCVDVNKYIFANKDRQQIYNQALKDYKNKKYDKALEGFNKVIELAGVSPELYNDLAITYIHYGDYKKSIEMSKKALDIAENNGVMSAVYFNLGLAYEKAGDVKSAKKYYSQAAKLDNKVAKSKLETINANNVNKFSNASDKVKSKNVVKSTGFTKGLFGRRD